MIHESAKTVNNMPQACLSNEKRGKLKRKQEKNKKNGRRKREKQRWLKNRDRGCRLMGEKKVLTRNREIMGGKISPSLGRGKTELAERKTWG